MCIIELRVLQTVAQLDSGSRLFPMVSQGFNAGAEMMNLVMAAFREGKSQCKFQLFQLVVLFRKGDGGRRDREGFHGFTFFPFCHHGLPSVATGT